MSTQDDKQAGTPPEIARERRLLRRLLNAVRTSISRLLQVSEERKPKLYREIFRGSELADLNYWLEILFSLGIATLGLIISSPAIVIGAMLISPLMGPIFGFGLALALGDFYLGFKSLLNLLLSILVSVLLAAFITWVLPFRTPTPEILARVQPTLLDLGVAVLSGLAGAVVVCRGGQGGGVTALPGVAVAVSLMPPLGVVGFGVGIGWDWIIVRGSGLLFLTNLVAIILSSFVVFFVVRMDAASVRREINEWLEEQEKTEAFYDFIDRTPLRRLLGSVGTLPRRMAILLVFLALVAFPLGSTLQQIQRDAQIRRAVLDELQRRISRDSIVNQSIEITADRIRLRVVAVLPSGFSAADQQTLEESIRARADRPVQVTVVAVATREEVAQLASHAAQPAAQPVIESVAEMRAKLLARVEPALLGVWPAERTPLLGFRVSFAPQSPGARIDLFYLGESEMGELGAATLKKSLEERLGVTGLEVRPQRVLPEHRLKFAAGRDQLPAAASETLDGVAAALMRFPRLRCAVRLPARAGGAPTALDRKRGETVRKYLIEEKKVAPERIELAQGPGERDVVTIQLLPSARSP